MRRGQVTLCGGQQIRAAGQNRAEDYLSMIQTVGHTCYAACSRETAAMACAAT